MKKKGNTRKERDGEERRAARTHFLHAKSVEEKESLDDDDDDDDDQCESCQYYYSIHVQESRRSCPARARDERTRAVNDRPSRWKRKVQLQRRDGTVIGGSRKVIDQFRVVEEGDEFERER